MKGLSVNIIVEGKTERVFIDDVLAPYLHRKKIFLKAIIIGEPDKKGGDVTFKRAKYNIIALLRQWKSCFVTTFFDFYGIDRQFPGYLEVEKKLKTGISLTAQEKGDIVEGRLLDELRKHYDNNLKKRFIPYLQVHEFEALLFGDRDILAQTIETTPKKPVLKPRDISSILSRFPNPEEINDNPHTAPSKRLYGSEQRTAKNTTSKVVFAQDVTKAIGIDKIRDRCPHFNQWLCKLEGLQETLY